jgi:hypothetical protein
MCADKVPQVRLTGTAPAGLQLDLIEAAATKRDDARFAERLARFDKQRTSDRLGAWPGLFKPEAQAKEMP